MFHDRDVRDREQELGVRSFGEVDFSRVGGQAALEREKVEQLKAKEKEKLLKLKEQERRKAERIIRLSYYGGF